MPAARGRAPRTVRAPCAPRTKACLRKHETGAMRPPTTVNTIRLAHRNGEPTYPKIKSEPPSSNQVVMWTPLEESTGSSVPPEPSLSRAPEECQLDHHPRRPNRGRPLRSQTLPLAPPPAGRSRTRPGPETPSPQILASCPPGRVAKPPRTCSRLCE